MRTKKQLDDANNQYLNALLSRVYNKSLSDDTRIWFIDMLKHDLDHGFVLTQKQIQKICQLDGTVGTYAHTTLCPTIDRDTIRKLTLVSIPNLVTGEATRGNGPMVLYSPLVALCAPGIP